MQTAASSREYAKYNALVLVLSFVGLSAAIFFIIQMTDDYKDSRVFVHKAIQWQSRTKGTVAIPGKHAYAFKKLSGNKFLDGNDVNALVLGSSSMMGIRREMFPKSWTAYNLSNIGQSLSDTIGEARYFVERHKNIQWIFISVDYSVGLAFKKKKIESYNPDEIEGKTALFDIFSDAITLNRLKITLKNIQQIIFRNDKEYLCPENDGRSKDFGVVLAPGECWGYRYDGSATFKYHKMSEIGWKSNLNERGLTRYIRNVEKLAGKVNQNHLNHLKAINNILMSRSGGLVLVSPPLMPGAEKFILAGAAGKYLQEYRETLNRWATINHVKLLDAGASEKYGCTPDEFYDPHHALDHCYSKIFDQFFRSNRGVL